LQAKSRNQNVVYSQLEAQFYVFSGFYVNFCGFEFYPCDAGHPMLRYIIKMVRQVRLTLEEIA